MTWMHLGRKDDIILRVWEDGWDTGIFILRG